MPPPPVSSSKVSIGLTDVLLSSRDISSHGTISYGIWNRGDVISAGLIQPYVFIFTPVFYL